jgi:AcrR family transcriptional regulator
MSSSGLETPTKSLGKPIGKPSSKLDAKPEPYHHGNLRATLLETAQILVGEVGIDGFSLRELARRANVSPAAPYHHFKDKAALIRALAQESQERLGVASQAALEGITHPMRRLSALGVAYVVYAFEHPSEFRIMFRRELHSPFPTGPLEAGQDHTPDPAFVLLRQTLIECRDANCIPINGERELYLATINAWALVHGLATLIIDGTLAQSITTREQVIALTRQITGGAMSPEPIISKPLQK